MPPLKNELIQEKKRELEEYKEYRKIKQRMREEKRQLKARERQSRRLEANKLSSQSSAYTPTKTLNNSPSMHDLFSRVPGSSVSCFITEENTKNNEEEKEEFDNKISKILKSYDLLKKNKIFKEVFKVN